MGRYSYSTECGVVPNWLFPFLHIYHDASEREPIGRDGDNSRSEEFRKLASLNQARFLVIVYEALGLTYWQTLDSSYSLIEVMMQEYSSIMRERSRTSDEDGIEGVDYEWVELPSFDDPDKTVRMKRFYDIGDKVKG
mgnify:CR=1 FL=1